MPIVPSPLTQTAELREMAYKFRALAAEVESKFPQLIKTVREEMPASLHRSGAADRNVEAVTAEVAFQLNKVAVAMTAVAAGSSDLLASLDEAVQIRIQGERRLNTNA